MAMKVRSAAMEWKTSIELIVCGRAAAWQAQPHATRIPASPKQQDLVVETNREGLSELTAMPPASASGALAIADDGLPVFLRRDPSVQMPAPMLEQLVTLEQNALAEEDQACRPV
ncbi:MAG: hypothetical protein KFB97_15685 [Cyanobium sp. M30B3]|nr:MAG: hypothetical protein KFB97_15685 [Cyanobium sp. M30B3]